MGHKRESKVISSIFFDIFLILMGILYYFFPLEDDDFEGTLNTILSDNSSGIQQSNITNTTIQQTNTTNNQQNTNKQSNTKICPTCNGKGTTSSESSQTTRITCPKCGGSGLFCAECGAPEDHGQGTITCSYCDGYGLIDRTIIKTNTKKCPTCGGDGRVSA